MKYLNFGYWIVRPILVISFLIGLLWHSPGVVHSQIVPWLPLGSPFVPAKTTRLFDLIADKQGTLLAAGVAGGVSISHDQGKTWIPMNTGLPTGSFASRVGFNSLGEPLAAARTGGGLTSPTFGYYYRNGSWQKSLGLSGNTGIANFLIAHDGSIFTGNAFEGEIFRSTDNGVSYTKLFNTGAALDVIYQRANDEIWAMGEPSAFFSSDNGKTWTKSSLADPEYHGNGLAFSHTTNGDLLEAGKRANSGASPFPIFRLMNGVWVPAVGTGTRVIPNWSSVTALFSPCDGVVYATTSVGVYVSTDDTQHWDPDNTGIDLSYAGSLVFRGFTSDGTHLYVYNDKIYQKPLSSLCATGATPTPSSPPAPPVSPTPSPKATVTLTKQAIDPLTLQPVASVSPGDRLVYTLTLINTSSVPANNVSVRDSVPTQTSFVAADTNGSLANGIVSWGLGTLGAGQTKTVTMTVQIN